MTNTIPFHPLADLFPLIEGTEFDELVYSIMEHGLREPITLFDGAILDGRNRYRACGVAAVEPCFETFTGDPHAFVADKNILRRHLTAGQRAMIAARMANMKAGDNQHSQEVSGIPNTSISATKAAHLLNVTKDMVTDARRILQDGTPDEIMAVERGERAISTLSEEIRTNVPKEQRDERASGKPQQDLRRINGNMWQSLSAALNALTDLPRPTDVVRIVRGNNSRTLAVDARLFKSLQWLMEFSDEWNKRNETTRQDGQGTGSDNHADTGTGDHAS